MTQSPTFCEKENRINFVSEMFVIQRMTELIFKLQSHTVMKY